MLTPEKIRAMEFQKSGFGGIKASDVDYFVEEVANDFETLIKQKNELIQKLQVLAENIEEYRNSENMVKTAIINAQRTADGIISDADAKAKALLEERTCQTNEMAHKANDTAEKLISDATAKARTILDEATMRANAIVHEAEAKAINAKRETDKMIGQQMLTYNYIKDEIKRFKDELMGNYKTHIELINRINAENRRIEDINNSRSEEPSVTADTSATEPVAVTEPVAPVTQTTDENE